MKNTGNLPYTGNIEAMLEDMHSDHTGQDEEQQTLHIYPIVNEGKLQGYYVSSIELPDEETPEGAIIESVPQGSVSFPPSAPDTGVTPAPPYRKPAPRGQIALLIISVSLLCIIVSYLFANAVNTAFFARTTIIITPDTRPFFSTFTLRLVTGVPPSLTKVEARRIPPITLAQRSTAQATGSYHQDPTYAVGYVTFYNGQFSPVTILAGTKLTGQNNASIITTQTATVPGIDQSSNPPALGQATISARAARIGETGNIPAYAISGSCCASSVLVKNTQRFTGGQDAKTYTIVQQSDITGQQALLQAAITHGMATTLQSQAKEGETIVPLPCSPVFIPNHKAGDEATSVSVTASETCSAFAYSRAALFHHILQIVEGHTPGAAYQLLEAPIVSIQTTTLSPGPAITIATRAVFVYRFTRQNIANITHRIAGLQETAAYQVLHSYPGIAHATINSPTERVPLPTNPNRLIMHVIYP